MQFMSRAARATHTTIVTMQEPFVHIHKGKTPEKWTIGKKKKKIMFVKLVPIIALTQSISSNFIFIFFNIFFILQ